MRWMMRAALMSILCTVVPMNVRAQGGIDHSVSGRLLVGGGVSCDRLLLELQIQGMQTVETTYSDPTCTFKFGSVPAGLYTIHIDADGYDEVSQVVELFEGAGALGITNIQLVPAPGREGAHSRQTTVSNGKPVVDVSEIMAQYPRKARDLYGKAKASRKKGSKEQAIKQLDQALKIAPDFYQAHNDIGGLYKETGRLEEAEAHFVRAHQLNPNSPEPLINLSSLYIEENEPERAVEFSQEAVKANSKSAPALFSLGLALYKLSRLDKAEAALMSALEIAPKMFQVHLALANVYLRLKRYDRMVDQLDTYLRENPRAANREEIEKLREKVVHARVEGL
jgi:Flp pilus assembly protein TadD